MYLHKYIQIEIRFSLDTSFTEISVLQQTKQQKKQQKTPQKNIKW